MVDALDLPNEEWSAPVDLQTGEVITISGEAAGLAEDKDLEDEVIPDRQIAPRVQDSDRYLRLPEKFDVHEWDLMRRFP